MIGIRDGFRRKVVAFAAVIAVCTGGLLLPATATAHGEDLPLDGEATVVDGDVQQAPFGWSDHGSEWGRISFELQESGDAELVVTYHYRSYYDHDRGAWANRSTYPYSDLESERYEAFTAEVTAMLEALAADASAKTGREMTVSAGQHNHGYDRNEGWTLQYHYSWTNFAEVRDDGSYVVTEPFTSGHSALAHETRDNGSHYATSVVGAFNGLSQGTYDVTLTGADGEVSQDLDSVRFDGTSSPSGARMVFSPPEPETATETVTATATPTPATQNTGVPLTGVLSVVAGVLVLALFAATAVAVGRRL